MTKRRIAIISGLGFLVIAGIFTTIYIRQDKSQEITFAECEKMGGVAWQVDLYHPEICSSCAEYRECDIEYNDYSEECPECYGACQECQINILCMSLVRSAMGHVKLVKTNISMNLKTRKNGTSFALNAKFVIIAEKN